MIESKIESLLDTWKTQIRYNEKIHSYRGTLQKRVFYLLSIIVAILEAITAVSLFTTFRNTDPQIISLINACLQVLALVLTALITYLDLGGESERNLNTAKEYDSLKRFIDTVQITFDPEKDDPKELLESIRNQYDEIVRNGSYISKIDKDTTIQLSYIDITGSLNAADSVVFSKRHSSSRNIKEELELELVEEPRNRSSSHSLKSIEIVDEKGGSMGHITLDIGEEDGDSTPRKTKIDPTKMSKLREMMKKEQARVSIDNRKKDGLTNLLRFQWGRVLQDE